MEGSEPGGRGMEMRRLCRESEGFSSSYSRLTVQTPLSVEGQQLTVREGASQLRSRRREGESGREKGNALDSGTIDSSFPVILHLSTPNPCPTGNPLLPSFNLISPLSLHAFLSTFGCVLNCRSLAPVCLAYDEGGGREMTRTVLAGSEMRRSRSPLSEREESPPSRFSSSDRVSRTTRCTLQNH